MQEMQEVSYTNVGDGLCAVPESPSYRNEIIMI